MIVIAEPYARYDKTLSAAQLESAATKLLEFVEAEIVSYYRRDGRDLDVKIFVRIERGSTKAWITAVTLANALIFYGSVRQSIDYLIKDAKYVSDLVLPSVPSQIGLGSAPPAVTQRRLGLPGQLHRLFQAVERREISAEEATRSAVDLLYRVEGPGVVDAVPGLTERLSGEIREASRVSREPVRRRRLPKPEPEPLAIAYEIPSIRRRNGLVARRDERGKIKVSSY